MTTYEQIEKEFDEEFVRDTGLMRVTPYSSSELPMADAIKSFLKQSFMKYLQGEVERLEKSKENFIHSNLSYELGYRLAISDQITNLQAQINSINNNE